MMFPLTPIPSPLGRGTKGEGTETYDETSHAYD